MKKIVINDDRRLNQSSIVIGYIEENKIEQIQFDIPEKYKDYGKKACFRAGNITFAKLFDNVTDNTLTLTRDITKYKELDMAIEFFKVENEDTIIARTSNLHIIIEDSVICDDVEPTEPKVSILDNLISETIKTINEANSLDIDIDGSIVTVTKKDGSTKVSDVKGEKGDKGDPGKFSLHIVNELPTTGEDGTLYLIKKETTSSEDSYNEYIYADGQWNLIGNTHIDLSDYYKRTETYSKQEIDEGFNTLEENIIAQIPEEKEAGVELTATYQNDLLELNLLNENGVSLSKAQATIKSQKENHYTWDKTTGAEAIALFQTVYNAYKNENKVLNVDLYDGERRLKLISIANPKAILGQVYCEFVGVDIVNNSANSVFMQNINAVVNTHNGAVTDITVLENINTFRLTREYNGNYGVLPVNNSREYVPTMEYNPATKKYVDITHYQNILGYNSTKTQTLKNVNGTLRWIDG